MTEQTIETGADTVEVTTETVSDAPEAEVVETVVEEAQATEATESTETDESETPELESDAGKDEADAEPEPEDVFEGLVPSFLSDEDIDKKFNRVPKEARTEMKRINSLAQETSAKIDEFGGEYAMQTLKPFADILLQDKITAEEANNALVPFVKANPKVGWELLEGVSQAMLAAPNTADPVLKTVFGEDASHEKIEALLKLERSGLIDLEDATREFKENYEYTDLYAKQQARQEELESEIRELKEAIRNPEKLKEYQPDTRATEAVKEFNSQANTTVSEALAPVFERVKWSKDSRLAKVVASEVYRSILDDADFQKASNYLKNNPTQKDYAGFVLKSLTGKAQARAIELTKAIQSDLRSLSENSRNAKLVKEKTAQVKETKPLEIPKEENLTPRQRQELLDEQFRNYIRSQRNFSEAANSKV